MSIRHLGHSSSKFEGLDLVPGPSSGIVTLTCTDFTSLCPVTSQPDFGEITITYQATGTIIETKSLKLYLQTWRGKKQFNEVLTEIILNELWNSFNAKPEWMKVESKFGVRGGISVSTVVERSSS